MEQSHSVISGVCSLVWAPQQVCQGWVPGVAVLGQPGGQASLCRWSWGLSAPCGLSGSLCRGADRQGSGHSYVLG